jgi:hypothetical protein
MIGLPQPSRAKRALFKEAQVPRRPWMAGSGLLQTFSMPRRKKQLPETKWELKDGMDVPKFGLRRVVNSGTMRFLGNITGAKDFDE